MGKTKFTGVKGMEDLIDPDAAKKWLWIEAQARKLFTAAGFCEIRTPILEDAALFERGVGETTEIVEKEMYTLLDRNERRLALRPEGTAPVVRAFVEHFTSHNVQEGRFLYMGPMFRYERPQKGRLRQFHQIGAEVFGADHPLLDAEMIGLIHQLFADLGLASLQLNLNSLGLPEDREKYRFALADFLQGIRETLCEECQRRIERNPLRALDCKKPGCIAATVKAPVLAQFYSPEAAEHFLALQEALKASGVPFHLNPRLVRGLDYYEKTVFEFLSGDLGAQNAVAAGGRYNGLVEDLGGPKVPGVGFALGMERLVAILPPHAALLSEPPRVYLIGLDPESEKILFSQLKGLRETSARVEMDFGGSSLKSKMRRADRWKADWVAILGEEERKKDIVILRDMKGQGQEEVPLDELFMRLIARFPTKHPGFV